MKRLALILILTIAALGWTDPTRYTGVVIWSKVLGDYLRSQGDSPYLEVIKQEINFNQAISNTQVPNLTMEIVHTEEFDFRDVLGDNSGEIINAVADPDFYFQQNRIKYGADFVYYIRKNLFEKVGDEVGDPRVGGRAGINGESATGAYYDAVFPHEIGHTLGLLHDRITAGIPSPSYGDYNRGYRIKDDGAGIDWGTIMSYAPNMSSFFSNPDITHPYYGPMGVRFDKADPAHASLALEQNAPSATEKKLTKPDLHETMIHVNLSKESQGAYYFKMFVPALHENPRIILEGGTGDADLFVGVNQFPTLGDVATIRCGSSGGDNNEECLVPTDFWRPESLYIMVCAYSDFEGATLRAEVDPPNKISKNYPALNLTGSYFDQYFMAELPEAATNVVFSLSSQNGDHQYANLEIFTYNDNGDYLHCTGAIQGDKKVCSFSEGGNYYITVNGTAFSQVTLSVDYNRDDVQLGKLTRDVWDSIKGTSVYDLEVSEFWEDENSSTSFISQFEGPTDVADKYGSRIHGYLHAPMSGYYTFYVAGDDNCQLWFSQNDDPEYVQLIADHVGWTNPREWIKFTRQKSDPIFLAANKRYYIKALHKEGEGGDNIAVAVESEYIPRQVIDGGLMEPYIDVKNPNMPIVNTVSNFTVAPYLEFESGGGGTGEFVIRDGYPGGYREINTRESRYNVEPYLGTHTVSVHELDAAGNISAGNSQYVYVVGSLEKDVAIEITGDPWTYSTYLLDVPLDYVPGTLEVRADFRPFEARMMVHLGVPTKIPPISEPACQTEGSQMVCNASNASVLWEQNGQWYIVLEFTDNDAPNDAPMTLWATYETDDTPAPPPSGDPGLYYGTVSGNINTTTANPKTSITTSLSETENGIGGNTTEIYTGMIYDADGNISFTEDMDDKVRLYIDGNLVLSSDNWSDRTSTGNLNLSAGWHDFELRISNGSGGSGPHSSPGFGYDPNGGANWIHPSDPGDGSLFRTEASPDGGPQTGVPYSVKYEHSGKCLGVVNGSQTNAANVEQQTCSGASHQKLTLNQEAGGYYSLRFQHSNQMLDIDGASTANEASAIQWPYHENDNQLFELVDHGNGTYSFKYKHSNRCVDVYGGRTSDGANVIQWDCHYNANQRFRFE